MTGFAVARIGSKPIAVAGAGVSVKAAADHLGIEPDDFRSYVLGLIAKGYLYDAGRETYGTTWLGLISTDPHLMALCAGTEN